MNTDYVRDLLKQNTELGIKKFYCGKIDTKYDQSICIYSLEKEAGMNIAVGGKSLTTEYEDFTILIRWNKNYVETEDASKRIYNFLANCNHIDFKNININYVEILDNSPRDLHCGDDGIFERLFDFRIYYKEK